MRQTKLLNGTNANSNLPGHSLSSSDNVGYSSEILELGSISVIMSTTNNILTSGLLCIAIKVETIKFNVVIFGVPYILAPEPWILTTLVSTLKN
jgi:hypothetical protein